MADTDLEQVTEDLGEYVGDDGTAPEGYVATCAREAISLVGSYVGATPVSAPYGFEPDGWGAYGGGIPVEILKRAILEVGAELYHRRTAPSGIRNFATEFGGSPVRLARDPMVAAYPILAPYVKGGFA